MWGHRRMPSKPGLAVVHIGIKIGQHCIKQADIGRIAGRLVKSPLTHFAQQLDRVMVDQFPQIRIDLRIQRLGFGMPAPPQVICQLSQAGNTLGDRREK